MARIVLPVAVDLNGDVIAAFERELVAGLHGAADAEVERVADDAGARRRGQAVRLVRRAVVHDDHVELRGVAADLADRAGDGAGFVVGGDDGEELAHVGDGDAGRCVSYPRQERTTRSEVSVTAPPTG